MSDLDLRERDTILKGGKRGPAIVPGKAEESLLYKAVRREGELQMPPGKTALTRGGSRRHARLDQRRGANGHRARRRPAERSLVVVPEAGPARGSRGEGLPRACAIRSTRSFSPSWRRKACGLPRRRTGGRWRAALTSTCTACRRRRSRWTSSSTTKSPDAYEKLIDRLLASPRYGERWGRYWLDLVRYADTSGFETDHFFTTAWRYRD